MARHDPSRLSNLTAMAEKSTTEGGDSMKAVFKHRDDVSVNLTMKDSGANVLAEAFAYSRTIGNAVASKLGLTGEEAKAKAGEIQRTLRRVRLAIENAE